jgi:hypothetical protein
MSSNKRRISRRALGVVVGASLLVLGLEAPAFATTTVTAFTPTSGPEDCVVVITGTGFLDFPQAQQDLVFVGPVPGDTDDVVLDGATPAEAALFARISATEIWVQTPTLAAGVAYQIRVDDPTGPGTASTNTYLQTSTAGGCAPTIASFTPICGLAGTTVVLTGTNLIGPGLVGGEVRFSPYATAQIAAHTVPDVDAPTSLSVVVPSGSADGRIQVTTFGAATGGQAFSATNFDVPPPDCITQPEVVRHPRSISFSLSRRGRARGVVSSTEDPAVTECVAGVPVKIQRRKKGGGWKNVGSTTTNDAGAYRTKVKPRRGKYRALATRITLEDDSVCTRARSATVRLRRR